MSSHQSSKEIRARLGHPVIDSDGHYIEFGPSIIDYIKKVAGPRVADAFVAPHYRIAAAIGMMPAERCDRGLAAEGFWVQPSKNTLDRATGIIPRLLYERLDEFGFDFTVLYPSAGLVVPRMEDNEMRRAVCALSICISPTSFATSRIESLPPRSFRCIHRRRQSRSSTTQLARSD